MSATQGSGNGETPAVIAQTTRGGPRDAVAPRELAMARGHGARTGALGRLAEIVLPADATAAGAARIVIGHCLMGLVPGRIVGDAQLLGSELVTNSLRHGRLERGDAVLVRVYVGAEALRIEVENPGTVGVIAVRARDARSAGGFGLQLLQGLAARWGVARANSTNVWFEMGRA